MTQGSIPHAAFGSAPANDPLGYPGKSPDRSGLLLPDRMLTLLPRSGRRLPQWRVLLDGSHLPGDTQRSGQVPLSYALLRHNQASLAQRIPLLASGSNAAPAQLWAKFTNQATSQILPMTLATEVRGLAVGLSAHVSKPGYIPFTPVLLKDAIASLFILWPDNFQLSALDKTEPNYHRVRINHNDVSVTLPSGEKLSHFYAYISRHGHIVDNSGNPILIPKVVSSDSSSGLQKSILDSLLLHDNTLIDIFGSSPTSFIENMRRDPSSRNEVRRIFQQRGWATRDQLTTKLISQSGGDDENLARPLATTYGATPPAHPIEHGQTGR
jgi:hypothetical protein